MLRYNLPDRRKAYRVYTRIPVVCEITNPQDKSISKRNLMITDLNSQGLFLETDEPLALNIEINVAFQLPKSSNTINATVRVARVEIKEAENEFGIGATFIKIADRDKEEIRQLIERVNINMLLELTIKKGASDLHLVTDLPPVFRIHGEIEISDLPKLDAEDIPALVYSIMTRKQIRRFEQEKELDFGMQYDIQNRFRANLHQQRGFLEATFRLVNTRVSSFEELRIPEAVKDLARQRDGLVLIVGPTGSGKTTTIAAMVELINQERKAVVITLERPIEYVHPNIKSIIKQREIGVDTSSFSAALKSSLKQDPNVIIIGELEDIETIRTALIAAEAGYLVIVSFHAPNTIQAIDRLVGFFPVENRRQVLSQLANCLKGIVSQLLLIRNDKQGRVLATEIVIANDAVRKIVRNDELIQLGTIIQTNAALGMRSMDDSVREYYEQGLIDGAEFYSKWTK